MPNLPLREIRKRLGQCVECGAPAAKEHQYCQRHLEYHREVSRRRRLKLDQQRREQR